MELYLSLIANVILFILLVSKSGKSNVTPTVEEKIVYVPEIRYRDKIEYRDRVVYQDRIVKEYVSNPNSGVVINNNVGNTEKKVIKKVTPKKIKPVDTPVVKNYGDVSPKKAEILAELDLLKSKKKKTKQDLETIYTLEMVLPNIK